MRGYMFRSKLGALVFIGSVLFAVFRLVGTEDQAGEIALAGERIAKQREGLEAQGSGSAQQPETGKRTIWQPTAGATGVG